MDINSLLSPSETPRSVSSTPSSPKTNPFKFVQRAQSGPGPLKHALGASPLSQSVTSQSSIPAHILSPASQQMSSPLINPVPATSGSQLVRSISTPSIDTIADLASMQGQTMKSNSAHLRSIEGPDHANSPTIFSPSIAANLTSNPRASFDINMMEAPKQAIRSDFSDSSLPTEKQERLSQLMIYVQETPSAYESHIEIIKILHQGFIDHIYPPTDSNTRRDPHTYDLLSDLRDAREAMEKLFAVGEHLWTDWLQDESILARTAEERIAVVEQCRRAVEEEVGSVSLWAAYGDWVRHCYEWAHDKSSEADIDEERMVGRELFTWQLVLDTWQEAVEQTALNLAESHMIWNKYIAIRIPNVMQKSTADEVSIYMALFERRLQTPHSAWDDTFQLFSSFVSANFGSEEYEKIMSNMLRSAAEAKKKWSARESLETKIEETQRSDDREAEYDSFIKYLEWEQVTDKKKKPNAELVNALFQRAELRFPSDAALWGEHVAFLLSHSRPNLLLVLEQATKHCPWSGSLWSQYLLSSDRAGQAFHETENIKHKATSTGLLDAGGIEEVINVHGTWCSYLRRRSFRPDASEEDSDVAEMGIRSSIENVASLAAKLGLGTVSDPSFRLYRIYIAFLTESARLDNARQEFDDSIQDYGTSWEFWMLFYNWEMGRWRRIASNQHNTSNESLGNAGPPNLATAVLKKALEQPTLDYPEPIMQALITHCEDFEDAEELQLAIMNVQRMRKAVAARRRIEAAVAAQAVPDAAAEVKNAVMSTQGAKRKREDDLVDFSHKKPKSEDLAHETVEQVEPLYPKRDRENATVLVGNLPEDITDTRIRQYFSNCGVIRAMKVLRDEGVSAIVEFDDDEAARYALSRDEQDLDGAVLSVSLDTGSTLYLTNYKPSADETYIHRLLDKYGEIVSTRFPSLQGNKKRRFCYVQFKSPNEAQTASAELDGQKVDEYTITCKISNPGRRQIRKDINVNEGHTVFVGQLNFEATEAEVEKLFSEYGTIQKIRMPLHPTRKNRNKGIAYVTYTDLDQAETTIAALNGHVFQDRAITVEPAINKNMAASRRESSARSVTPFQNGENGSIGSVETASRLDRQVFLTNVPDTVNEARLRELASGYGTLTRVTLKTNHAGAILEYSDAKAAGQASLQLDGHEIAPERKLRVVTESEMLSYTREKKSDGYATLKDKPKPKTAAPIGASAPPKRPFQPGVRKGGNLGQRNIARHQSSLKREELNGSDIRNQKSNNDFRAMLKKDD